MCCRILRFQVMQFVSGTLTLRERVRSVGVSPTKEPRGLGVSPKSGLDSRVQAQARTGLSVPRKVWLGRLAQEWLGQSCPSIGTDRTVRATNARARCLCHAGAAGETPTPHSNTSQGILFM
ncbi:MAG: hypothetical protein NZ556_06730 [Fimbriimonadales bacterium]|nr:hypothetical protein [Fimbriimonadales bacterium]